MRESLIETRAVAKAKIRGWLTRKLQWVGRRGAPDRVFVGEKEPCLLCGNRAVIVFVEFKAPGEEPRALQKKEISRLQERGVRVLVVDSMEDVDGIFEA